jgi:uncharacterized protein
MPFAAVTSMTARADVDAYLSNVAMAVVGVSRSGKKFGNMALRELRAKGYRVYPVHPSASAIDGVACVRRFADLPERVDAALIVVPPREALGVVRDAAAAGIHYVWLQQGAESPEVLELCRVLRITVVSGECILMFAAPTSFHRLHRTLWRLLGKLPK